MTHEKKETHLWRQRICHWIVKASPRAGHWESRTEKEAKVHEQGQGLLDLAMPMTRREMNFGDSSYTD